MTAHPHFQPTHDVHSSAPHDQPHAQVAIYRVLFPCIICILRVTAGTDQGLFPLPPVADQAHPHHPHPAHPAHPAHPVFCSNWSI